MAAGGRLFGTKADLVIVDDVQPKYDEWEDQATLLSCVECGAENLSLFEYRELHGMCSSCYEELANRAATETD